MEDHHVLCVDAVSLGSVTLEVTTQGSWVHFTCHRPPRRKRVWTLCFTIYRDSFVVTATSKEATLTEYADRVPGNGQVRLSRQTVYIPQPCLWSGLSAPSPHVNGASAWPVSESPHLHSPVLPILDSQAKAGPCHQAHQEARESVRLGKGVGPHTQ